MVSFNLNRRQAFLANSRPTNTVHNKVNTAFPNTPHQEELLRQQQYSFAASVLAASMSFRPFNPSFSRRPRPPPSSSSSNKKLTRTAASPKTPTTVKAVAAGPGTLQQQRQPSKSDAPKVSFAIFHDTRYTLGLGDYTYKEREATWYSPQELAMFVVDRQECLRLLELGLELDDVKLTGRGLEHLTRKGFATSSRNIRLGRTVIREEQHDSTLRHKRCFTKEDNDNHDENSEGVVERMAAAYGAACSGSAKEAHRVALREMISNEKYLVCENEAYRTPTSDRGADVTPGNPQTRIASAA
jgi:hypothetical protein